MLTYDKIVRRQRIRAVAGKVLLILFLVIVSILVGWGIAYIGTR